MTGVGTSAPSAVSCSTRRGITASPYSTATTVPPLCSRHHEAGQGARLAAVPLLSTEHPISHNGRSEGSGRSRTAALFLSSVLALNIRLSQSHYYIAWSWRHTHTETCGKKTCECCVSPPCLVRGLRLMRLHSLLQLLLLVLLGCYSTGILQYSIKAFY